MGGAIKCVAHFLTSKFIEDCAAHPLTTLAGFLPLILSDGDFWPEFATTVAGGVLLSTVISFFFVPQIFLLLTRLRPFRARKLEEFSLESPVSKTNIGTDLTGDPA